MILVTGGKGLIGSEFTGAKRLDVAELDVTNRDKVFEVFQEEKPTAVVHCAAIINSDACEKDKETALAVNVEGTRNVFDACVENNAKMIFLSTDYVFDGLKNNYSEADEPNPINYYGVTKRAAEEIVLANENFVVVRTSWVYGPSEKNFLFWLANELKAGRRLRIVNDQYSTPAYSKDVANACLFLLEKNAFGLYHAAGPGLMTRLEMAERIAAALGLDSSLIESVSSSEFNWLAKRPLKTGLDSTKLRELGFSLRSLEEGISDLKERGVL